jgi:hypothetical protein
MTERMKKENKRKKRKETRTKIFYLYLIFYIGTSVFPFLEANQKDDNNNGEKKL